MALKKTVYRFLATRCDLCGDRVSGLGCLCLHCLDDLRRIDSPCLRCGLPLHQQAVICGRCLIGPHLAETTVAPFLYCYPLDALIKKFKYRQQLHLVSPLAETLARRLLAQQRALPELMVPVPLHPGRMYYRGFNQALMICRVLHRKLGVSYDHRLVRRCRNTSPMYDLKPAERLKNIKNAFRITRPLPVHTLAVVDDIVTSGSTANEMARVLKKAGARRVEVWALARAE